MTRGFFMQNPLIPRLLAILGFLLAFLADVKFVSPFAGASVGAGSSVSVPIRIDFQDAEAVAYCHRALMACVDDCRRLEIPALVEGCMSGCGIGYLNCEYRLW